MDRVNDGKMRESLQFAWLYMLSLSFGNHAFSATRPAQIREYSYDEVPNGSLCKAAAGVFKNIGPDWGEIAIPAC